MTLSIQFLGASDGDDGPFHLASASGWAAFSRWVAEAASLGSPLPLLSALTNDGECKDTSALGDELHFALKDHPPVEEPVVWDIAKVLLEVVGVGDRDEVARVVDGDESEATANSNPEGCNQWKKCEGGELLGYHSPTKGAFAGGKPSVDVGSDYDVMGKGFYFGTHEYASKYGNPQEFKIAGKLAASSEWIAALAKHSKKPTDKQRAAAREELKQKGYVGVLSKEVGVVWDQSAIIGK